LRWSAIEYPYGPGGGTLAAPQISAGSVDSGLTALLAATQTSFYVDVSGQEIHMKLFPDGTVSSRVAQGREDIFYELELYPS